MGECRCGREPGHIRIKAAGCEPVPPAPSLGAGSAGDVEGLVSWEALDHAAHYCGWRILDHDSDEIEGVCEETTARALAEWLAPVLAAHVARAPTADRERVARVEALIQEAERMIWPGGSASVSLHSLRAALAAPHVEQEGM